MKSYATLYQKYEDARSLMKLKMYALWTIPGAFPDISNDNDATGNTDIEHDYQSIGATLVNFLAAKLTGILFPVTQSFFKIQAEEALLQLAEQVWGQDKAAVDNKLVQLENKACKALFKNASYAQLLQMIIYLIITGNCLFKRVNGKLTVYSLRNYTRLCDNEGNVLDVIVKEVWSYSSLPSEVQAIAKPRGNQDEHAPVEVYTRIKYEQRASGTVCVVSQQINNTDIGIPSTYPEHLCPYRTVVWKQVNGDSYGRGLVEDHAGDFAKLSDLSRAYAMYQINACKVVNFVKPGSTVDIDSLNGAYSGEWVQGDVGNVSAHEAGDAAKMQQLSAEIQAIFQRLSIAFMYQGNTRNAERVTAEELQMNAREAESALGGVYSQLSQGIHLPLSYLLCNEVDSDFIHALIAGEVTLEVITGLPALGRSTVVTQVLQAVQELAVIIPALKQLSPRCDIEKVIDLVLQARGVNLEDIMLSPEALKEQQRVQEQQQAQQSAAMMGDPTQTASTIQGML
jgi:hypothetical protein